MRLTVERLGHLGDGVAQVDEGGPVYIPRTLPGEVVEGVVAGGVMAHPKIVIPSAQRVPAPCPHYAQCGGCALEHAADAFVAGWKQEVVAEALAAQGISTLFRPISTSPPRSRRRATLAGRRTKKGVLVGFHGRASGTIVAVPECLLLRPELQSAFPALEALTAAGASRKGELALAVTQSEAGPDVAVTGGKPLDGPLRATLAGLAEAHRLARLSWDGEPVAQRAAPTQRFGAARVVPPPGAFLQATAEGEAALVAGVKAALGRPKRLADLFAGCGTFTLPLSTLAEVHAVEASPGMLAALDSGWRATPGLHRVSTEARDLFRRPLVPEELRRFDALLLDPPRAGAAAQVAEVARAAASGHAPIVAMVSCNPVSFARDARTLVQAGYRLDWVQVVDQFRWSTHVELVARFVPA